MERSKRIVFVSHCILNQNTVVEPLARSRGAYGDIVRLLVDKGIGIHQMPCPEFRHLGLERRPMIKAEYDTKEYRDLCRGLALDTFGIIEEYKKNSYEILGMIGILESPTCSISKKRGIFMEELMKILDEKNYIINNYDVPADYYDGEKGKAFIQSLEENLK